MSSFIAAQEIVLVRTERHSSRPTYCLIWEILFLVEKRNKPSHFYSHLQQDWSNINNVTADWIYRAREVLTREGKIFKDVMVITYKKL